MTVDALQNRDEGYIHVDFWSLNDSSRSCAVYNLIALQLLRSAADVSDDEEDIIDLEKALVILRQHLSEYGYVLDRPCRIILEKYPSGSLGNSALHIGGEFKRSPGFKRPREEISFPIGMTLGGLYLHEGDSDSAARPVAPRVDDSKMLVHLSRLVFQRAPWRTAEDYCAVASSSLGSRPFSRQLTDITATGFEAV